MQALWIEILERLAVDVLIQIPGTTLKPDRVSGARVQSGILVVRAPPFGTAGR